MGGGRSNGEGKQFKVRGSKFEVKNGRYGNDGKYGSYEEHVSASL
jgi:hypothetical protein